MVVLMTEFGNRVALAAGDIDSVTVDSESRGFGHQLNASTMALGWAPNDALDPDSDEGRAAMAAQAAAAASASQAPPVYNQQQFIEPGETTGLPVWMTGINAVPQVQPAVTAGAAAAVESPQNCSAHGSARCGAFLDNHDVAVAPREIAGLARGKPVESRRGPRHCNRVRNRRHHCAPEIEVRSGAREGPGVGRSGSQETCRSSDVFVPRGVGSDPGRPRRTPPLVSPFPFGETSIFAKGDRPCAFPSLSSLRSSGE